MGLILRIHVKMKGENLFPKSCPLTSSAVLVSDDDDGDGYDLGTVVNIYIYILIIPEFEKWR